MIEHSRVKKTTISFKLNSRLRVLISIFKDRVTCNLEYSNETITIVNMQIVDKIPILFV